MVGIVVAVVGVSDRNLAAAAAECSNEFARMVFSVAVAAAVVAWELRRRFDSAGPE